MGLLQIGFYFVIRTLIINKYSCISSKHLSRGLRIDDLFYIFWAFSIIVSQNLKVNGIRQLVFFTKYTQTSAFKQQVGVFITTNLRFKT